MTPSAHPIPMETFAAWWTGELSADEATRVEEHLFACDECARASERFASLAAGLLELNPPVISHSHRDRLLARGTRIKVTPVEAGVPARAVFDLDLDFLVHALRANLARAERVDVEILIEAHGEPLVYEGVPFDAMAGEVLICCQRHFEHLFPGDPTFRVHAVESGQRRLVGEYLVHHVWR
jgi:hypothetical protein